MPEPFKPAISTLLTPTSGVHDAAGDAAPQPGSHRVTQFICRNAPQIPLSRLVDDVREQLEYRAAQRFTDHDIALPGTRAYIKKDPLERLGIFRLQMKFLEIAADGDGLRIVARGPLLHITAFEIRAVDRQRAVLRRRRWPLVVGRCRLAAKIEHLKSFMADLRNQRQAIRTSSSTLGIAAALLARMASTK